MTALAHAYWILRHEQRLLICCADPQAPFPLLPPSTADAASAPPLAVGEWQGRPCYAAELKIFPEHPDLQPLPLRALFAQSGPEAFARRTRRAVARLAGPAPFLRSLRHADRGSVR